MKLISLNVWGGRVHGPLMEFLKRRSADVDVFCLQEVMDAGPEPIPSTRPEEAPPWTELFREIVEALPDFDGTFARHEKAPKRQSLAMFVRKTVLRSAIVETMVYEPPPAPDGRILWRKLQYATVADGSRPTMIANFHGLWQGGPKTDTPERLEQSRRVSAFLRTQAAPAILCGDMNLLPDTESMRILETGMRNMITEFGITNTRTPLYREYDNPEMTKFADYILVAPDVKVMRFEVLPDAVSDHAALFLEFS